MHVSQLLNTQLALAESIGYALGHYHGSTPTVGLNRPELPEWCEHQSDRNKLIALWAAAIEWHRVAKGGQPDADDWFHITQRQYSLLRITDDLSLCLLEWIEEHDRSHISSGRFWGWADRAVAGAIKKLDSAATDQHEAWIGLRP